MAEQDPLNNLPINQESKRLLEQAGETPDPSLLYALQLIQWAILEGKHGLPRAVKISLRGHVESLLVMDSKRVMDFLTQGDDPDEVRLTAEELLGATPEEAAETLIEALHSALSARIQGYPPAA